jgi:hypothetical protein
MFGLDNVVVLYCDGMAKVRRYIASGLNKADLDIYQTTQSLRLRNPPE